jgi:hypothetical protein
LRACLRPLNLPLAGGFVYVIKNGSKLEIGPKNLLLAERRRRQLPTPTLPTPKRRELIDEIDLEPTDPSVYDRFCNTTDEDSHGTA